MTRKKPMKNKSIICAQIPLILFLLIILLILQNCDRKTNPISPLPNYHVAKLDSVLQIVIPNVSDIRKLNCQKAVTVSPFERERFSKYYGNDSSWLEWQEYIEYHEDFLFQFGFIGRDDNITDLNQLWKTYLSQFPIAFYVPGTDSILVVVDNLQDIDSLVSEEWFESLLAHELTHALQDQNFDAFRRSDSIYTFGSSDEYSAVEGLIEGDACFVENLYYYKYIHSDNNWLENGKWWSESLADSLFKFTVDRIFEYPLFMEIPSYFPYYLGPGYISRKYVNNSWSEIDVLYNNYPKSSAMLFENANKSPVDISLDEFLNEMDTSQYFFSDVLGPIGLFTLLSHSQTDWITIEDYRRGFQWMGDRLLYSKNSSQTVGKIVWKVTFERETYAEHEYERLKALVQNDNNRFVRPNFVMAGPDSVISGILCSHYVSEKQNSFVLRYENTVYWIENLPLSKAEIIQNIQNGVLGKRKDFQPQNENRNRLPKNLFRTIWKLRAEHIKKSGAGRKIGKTEERRQKR